MNWLVVARYELPDGAVAAKMYFHPARFATKAEALSAIARVDTVPPPRPVCSCCGGAPHSGVPYADDYKIVLDVEPEEWTEPVE